MIVLAFRGEWAYDATRDEYLCSESTTRHHLLGRFFRGLMQQEHAQRAMPEAFEFYLEIEKSRTNPGPT